MTNPALLQTEVPAIDAFQDGDEAQSSASLTTRYVVDVINHVAEVHVSYALTRVEEVEKSIRRYDAWREGRVDGSRLKEACEFASFFAIELLQGSLSPRLSKQLRTMIALDFIIHVILENNLRSNIWRIEHDVPATFRLLNTADLTPDQLLTNFSLGKW
jgi:hypothetical protein